MVSGIEHTLQRVKKGKLGSAEEIYEDLPDEVKLHLGGETTCVEVKEGRHRIIFDLGTGSRALGDQIVKESPSGELHILMTHTHWDHIQGWPFFLPQYCPGYTINFYSALEDCRKRFETQQDFSFFPVAFSETASTKTFTEFRPGEMYQIGPFQIEISYLCHPGGAAAYRVHTKDGVFIFATDTEIFGADLEKIYEENRSFFQDADMLLIDAQYSIEEMAEKIGWGHTAMPVAIEAASRWNVKHLILTHHEPAHSDERIVKLFNHHRSEWEKANHRYPEKIELAIEGNSYTL